MMFLRGWGMVNRFVNSCAIVAMGLQLAGCYTEYGPVVTNSEPVAPYSVASRLQTGDQLKIIVFGEDSLSGIYEISPAGVHYDATRRIGHGSGANQLLKWRTPSPAPMPR